MNDYMKRQAEQMRQMTPLEQAATAGSAAQSAPMTKEREMELARQLVNVYQPSGPTLDIEHSHAGFYIVKLNCPGFSAFEIVSGMSFLREWRLKRSKKRLYARLQAALNVLDGETTVQAEKKDG